jgi:hypothetical protein
MIPIEAVTLGVIVIGGCMGTVLMSAVWLSGVARRSRSRH